MSHSENRDPDTIELLERAARGEESAGWQLISRQEEKLRRLIAARMDARVAARFDPSDVVQEASVEAWRELPEYLRSRPLPFYPWIRRIALERLAKLHMLHIGAQKRSVSKEDRPLFLSPESVGRLAGDLVAGGSSPSGAAARRELFEKVEHALARLSEPDREILVLRHLEQLSVREIAEVLGISETAVKVRRFRALQRLRALLGDDFLEEDR